MLLVIGLICAGCTLASEPQIGKGLLPAGHVLLAAANGGKLMITIAVTNEASGPIEGRISAVRGISRTNRVELAPGPAVVNWSHPADNRGGAGLMRWRFGGVGWYLRGTKFRIEGAGTTNLNVACDFSTSRGLRLNILHWPPNTLEPKKKEAEAVWSQLRILRGEVVAP